MSKNMIKNWWNNIKEDKHKRRVVLAFFLLAFFLILFTEPYFNTYNVISRYLTIESIVEDGDFIIDERHQATGDKIYREGHYYSSKPPILSVAASSIYYITHNFFGQDFPETGINTRSEYFHSIYPTVYVANLIFVGLPFLFLLFYFYKTLKLFYIKSRYHLPLILGLGLGSLLFTYSVTFNNHVIAGSLLFIGFYYLLLIKKFNYKFDDINKYLFLSGLFTSLSAVIDLPTGLTFFALFFVYFFLKLGFRKILYYIGPALIIFSLHLYFNYQAFGGFLPAQAYEDYWIGPDGELVLIHFFRDHSWYTLLFNIFIGTNGFFIYTPLLLLPLYSIYKIIKEKSEFIWEALMIVFGFIILILFYINLAKDYGGGAYGYRWFIAIAPLFYFFIIFLFKKTLSAKMSTVFTILLLWSCIVAIIGVFDPWPQSLRFDIFGTLFPVPPLWVALGLDYSFLY